MVARPVEPYYFHLPPCGAISVAGAWIETRRNLPSSAGTLMLNRQLAFMSITVYMDGLKGKCKCRTAKVLVDVHYIQYAICTSVP